MRPMPSLKNIDSTSIDSDATPDTAFAYDATSNVVQMTDGAGTET